MKKQPLPEKLNEYQKHEFIDIFGNKFYLKINCDKTGSLILERECIKTRFLDSPKKLIDFCLENGFKCKKV